MRIDLILCGIAFVLSLTPCLSEVQKATDAPLPLSPEESAKRMQLPDGFRIELVASEPIVQEPSCIAWDERGRLYVCELHGYNIEGHLDTEALNKTGELDKTVRRVRWEFQGGEIADQAAQRQTGTLKLLTDTDGDGRMDKANIWANDLPPCYGVVAARKGVIVTCAPHIIYFADHDGDGMPDERETLFSGFHIETLERGINNPIWGLDNWIYVGSGGNGGTITGPHLEQAVTLGRSDFRIKADGSDIEPVNGSVGTFGLTMNDIGDRFPSSGGTPARYALPLPYHYLSRNPHIPSPNGTHTASDYHRGYRISKPHPWRVKRRKDPAWVKFYGDRETNSNYFSGGCSTTFYGGERFPETYQGNLFYCEPSLNIIHRTVLTQDGANYQAKRPPSEENSEFLASTDQWFRPMNLRVGPEGALYIVDMYREIIEDYSAIPRFLQQQYGLDRGASYGRLWRLLPNQPTSDTTPDFSKLSPEELVKEIGHGNPWRRETAQRLLIEKQAHSASQSLTTQLEGPWKGTIRALYTLNDWGTLEPAHVLSTLSHEHGGVRLHALRLSEQFLANHEAVRKQVFSMTTDPDVGVRLQVAMSLGELQTEAAANRLVILSQKHGEERWMKAAILSSTNGEIGSWLARQGHFREQIAIAMAGRRDSNAITSELLYLNHEEPKAITPHLRGFIQGASQGDAPWPTPTNGWDLTATQLALMMTDQDPELRELAAAFAAKLPFDSSAYLEKFWESAAEQALAELPSQRLSGIRILASAPYEKLAPIAAKLLAPNQPPELQQAALEALSASQDPRVGDTLIKAWPSLTPKSRSLSLEALFAQKNRLPGLMTALENKVIHKGDLTPVQREQLLQSDDIAERTKQLFESSTANPNLPKRLAHYQKALDGQRDSALGKSVYEKHCIVCHQLGERGNEVGPSLTGALSKPDEGMLADILDPNGNIDPNYKLYLVTTPSGRTYAGVLASESATSLTLKRADGGTDTILRKHIATMTASEISLMPASFHTEISPEELAHLITYIRTAFASLDDSSQGQEIQP